MAAAGAGGWGREAGRQLGVVGRTFSPLSLANPDPPFPSCALEPSLAASQLPHSQPAVGGRKGSLPLAGAGGQKEEGGQAEGQDEDSKGVPDPFQRGAQLCSPLESEKAELGKPQRPNLSTPSNRGPERCLRSVGDAAANQLTTLTPNLTSWQPQSYSFLDPPLSP